MNATPQTPWSQLLQRLDPMTPIGLGITAKGASINRAFDAQLQRAIWDKRYELPANDPRLAYRVFSKWENTLIAQLKDKGVLGGPRFVALEQRASPMHSGATPMKDRDTGMSLLRTHDLGPDLDVWTRMRPCIQGAPKDHLLYRASDLLRLVRAILVALKDFHDHGFVHGDLHAGNVALPCRETHRASGNGPQGESITVQPLWDELRIFDLDASLSRHSAPPVVPYLHTDPAVMPRMSNHLRLRLCMLHALAESSGHDNAYNEQFWARQTGWDLQCLQKVDWREDLHQLGHLLKGLLQTEQCAIEYDHPDQDFLLDKLVEAFMAWGAPKQLSGLTTEQLNRRPTESAHAYYLRLREWVDHVEQLGTPAKPHTQYLAEIDVMLTKHPGTGSGVWVFRREDNDQGYVLNPLSQRSSASSSRMAQQQSSVRPGDTFRDSDIFPEMVVISPGEFWMGSLLGEKGRSKDEGPIHKVKIDYLFAISKYPITQRQWELVMGNNPSECKDPTLPVHSISWLDAQEYLSKVNELLIPGRERYRLPTEAEWEYVCRGGTITPFYTGTEISRDQANVVKDGNWGSFLLGLVGYKLMPPTKFPANPFGVCDLHGNTGEWVEDVWHPDYDGAPNDGSAWLVAGKSTVRVIRSPGVEPNYARSACRHKANSDHKGLHTGFRVVVRLR